MVSLLCIINLCFIFSHFPGRGACRQAEEQAQASRAERRSKAKEIQRVQVLISDNCFHPQSGSKSGIFFSPVSILMSYVLQRSVICATVIKGPNFVGLAGPLWTLLAPFHPLSSSFGTRCRTGIMRRVTLRRHPPTSLVSTLTQRRDTGERGQGMVLSSNCKHRNNS